MQIRRFFCESIPETGDEVSLNEGESQHALRVLRLEAGDRLQLLDGRGRVAEAEMLPPPSNMNPRKVRTAVCRILESRVVPRPASQLVLYVAPPRGKAFDLVLREAVELGMAEIHPLLCDFGVSKPEDTPEGWRATLMAALKQSCNPYMPELSRMASLEDTLKARRPCSGFFGASPGAEGRALAKMAVETDLERNGSDWETERRELWIGPEGGFSPAEEKVLLEAGLHPVTLGTSILRVETAVPALAGYVWGMEASHG